MRRITRLQQSVDLCFEPARRPLTSPSICRACRLRAASQARRAAFSTSATRRESGSLTEKLRKKLWKSEDAPPRDEPEYGAAQDPETDGDSRGYANKYEPASTWDNLEWVGEREWMHNQTDVGERFKGFMPDFKATTPEEIEPAVRRAVIEVFAARDAGIALEQLKTATFLDVEHLVDQVEMEVSERGNRVRLNYPSNEAKAELAKSIIVDQSYATTSAEPDTVSQTQREPYKGVEENLGWREVSLHDPMMKFIMIKRIMQLTGIRLSDPKIQHCDTPEKLIHALLQKPKPKRLAYMLEANESMMALNNVKLFDRRVTPIDREKEVGRWKVIEQELVNRGLPVTGHDV